MLKQRFDKIRYLTLLSQNGQTCVIKEDYKIEETLKRNLELEYAKQRQEVHVTDLTLCLRQSLFRKLQPVVPNTKQLSYFFDGARRHAALQQLYGQGVIEKEIEFEGVRATIDILDNFGPIEFKTTRAKNAVSEHWIRQLAFYMVATNSRFGILQVQRIMPGRQKSNEQENIFPAYLIELNEVQRGKWLEDFRERKQKFLSAYESKDVPRAPVYRGEGNWLCQECPYGTQCDKIEGVSLS
jgi:hypothetical protein